MRLAHLKPDSRLLLLFLPAFAPVAVFPCPLVLPLLPFLPPDVAAVVVAAAAAAAVPVAAAAPSMFSRARVWVGEALEVTETPARTVLVSICYCTVE